MTSHLTIRYGKANKCVWTLVASLFVVGLFAM